MRYAELPDEAFTATATPIPTRTIVVYDWEAMHRIMVEKGFVVIETDVVRSTKAGAAEAVLVKMFNSYIRQTKKLKLRTARIGKTRWLCTL